LKQYRWLIIGVVGCLVFAAIGYFWATGLMDSVFNYRSPLQNSPPTPGAPLGTQLTRRVIIVLVDALRTDTALDSQVMPYLNELRSQGASATMHSQPPSYSEPGYTTLLTGAWPDINDGPAVNLDYEEIPTFTQDDIFSAAHRIGLRTAISGYYWFEKLVPQQAVDTGFYTPGEDAAADQDVMNAALPMLAGDYQLVLIHLDQVDYAGHHEGGPLDPRWNAAAARCDDYLRQVVSALDLKLDTVIVLSDHGQIDRGGHGGPEPITLLEPFVMAGAGIRPGQYGNMNMVDVAPTIATLLGTNIPATSQGHVLTDMLTLTPEQDTTIQAALAVQQDHLCEAYTTALGATGKVPEGREVVTATQNAMDSIRAQRLSGERLWRTLLALIIAAIPTTILVLRRNKKNLWPVIGALVYVLLFNFRYAILDGRTYSLSSVEGQMWLITYTATTASVALVIGWLVAVFGAGAVRLGSRKAAETSLVFVFLAIYLLALPILVSFAVNGPLVTWTLPEFYTSYIALLSLIQWLFVAVVGLLLTGIAAGMAWLIAKRT
jgi:hypothetical protein